MARVELEHAVVGGNPLTAVSGATVVVRTAGGSLASVYAASSGGSPIAGSALSTDNAGRIEGYVEEGADYLLEVSKPGVIVAYTQRIRVPALTGGGGGAPAAHTHPQSEVTSLTADLAAKAPLVDQLNRFPKELDVIVAGPLIANFGNIPCLQLRSGVSDSIGFHAALPAHWQTCDLDVHWTAGTAGTATTTSGSADLTVVSPTTGWLNGMAITGAGIPAGTTIVSGAGTATMVMSAPATASASGVAIAGALLGNPTLRADTKKLAVGTPLNSPYDTTGASFSGSTLSAPLALMKATVAANIVADPSKELWCRLFRLATGGDGLGTLIGVERIVLRRSS